MRPAAIAAVFLSVAGSGVLHAAPQFTADAIETEPGRDMRYVRMFVGEKGSRYEFQISGQPVVQIVKPGEGVALTLFPLSRTYLESRSSPDTSPAGFRPMAACQPSPLVDCKMEAETQAGSPSPQKIERWTVTSKAEPGGVRLWWDTQRKIAVRQEFPDGRVMQANMLGTLSFDNRTVENWEFLYLAPSGSYQRGMTLFSPELGFAVAEKQPGGVSRELRNIQLGELDAKLFEAPEGYKKMESAQPVRGADAPGAALPIMPAPSSPMPVSQPNAPIGPMTAPQPQGPRPVMPFGFPAIPTQAGSPAVNVPAPSNPPPPYPPYSWQLGPSPQAWRPDRQGPGFEPAARP
jgi:hypothetical protein